jgi:hypothetical protein
MRQSIKAAIGRKMEALENGEKERPERIETCPI